MLALASQVRLWMLLVFGACALWRYVLVRTGGPLPSMILRVCVFLPVATGVLMTYGANPDAAGMLTFLIALLSLKILELRSARDVTVVSLLGYFMVLSSFFYDQSLITSLYLGVALLVNTTALIRCHSGGRPNAGPALRLAIGMFCQAIPLVVLLFVIFPRLQANFLRRIGGGTMGQTGINDHLEPGSFSSLVQSNDPAFRAKIGDGSILPQRELYWRGVVLDVCESSMSWKAGPQTPVMMREHPVASTRQSQPIEQQITLFARGDRYLFALDRPVGIKPSSSLQAQLFNSEVLQSRVPLLSTVIYYPTSELNRADHGLSSIHRQLYTRLPPDLGERAKALAKSWTAAAHSEEDIIRAAGQYFRDGGFVYTLSPGLLPKTGALDQFLFSSKRGFCEHYAAAFATLMRAAGLPSRIVTGYQGGEFNSWSGKYYLVHQSDAHAWCEVYLTDRGWQREDPTALVAPDRVSFGAGNYAALGSDGPLSAEARLERLNELNTPGSWRWMLRHTLLAWDGVDQQWNLFVLGYDQDKQQSVLQSVGMENLSWLAGTAMALAMLATVLLGGTATMRAFNRGPARSDDPLRRLYVRFCRRLASAGGVRRENTEGPLDFARRASSAFPEDAAEIRRITELYVAGRYAPSAGVQAVSRMREAVRKFRPKRHNV